MTRDLLVMPRRIAFVHSKENQLYETLMEMVVKKQDEIRAIINSTLEQLRAHVPSLVDDLEFPGMYYTLYMAFSVPWLHVSLG